MEKSGFMQPGWRCGLSMSGGASVSQPSTEGSWASALVHGEGSSDLMQSCMQLCFIIDWAHAQGPGCFATMFDTFHPWGFCYERDAVPGMLLVFTREHQWRLQWLQLSAGRTKASVLGSWLVWNLKYLSCQMQGVLPLQPECGQMNHTSGTEDGAALCLVLLWMLHREWVFRDAFTWMSHQSEGHKPQALTPVLRLSRHPCHCSDGWFVDSQSLMRWIALPCHGLLWVSLLLLFGWFLAWSSKGNEAASPFCGSCPFWNSPLPWCVRRREDALGMSMSCWEEQGGSRWVNSPTQKVPSSRGQWWPCWTRVAWSLGHVSIGQQKIKPWVVGFSSMTFEDANVFFCDDYFRIALLLQGSPHYLFIQIYPPDGWCKCFQ